MTQATGRVIEMRKPVQRAASGVYLREGSTGRVVPVVAMPVRLRRVWAVGEVGLVADPTHDDGTVMNGPPRLVDRVSGGGEIVPAHISESRYGAPVSVAAPGVKAELACGSPKAELACGSPKAELACGSPKAELAFYRKYTEALLRRYMRMSMSAGRVPSLMGRELFRGHVSHYKAHTFEDVAIFCFDVERQLARLTPAEKELVKRISLQQYTHLEAAGILGLSLSHCVRRYGATLDRLTGLFLTAKLLEPQILSRG